MPKGRFAPSPSGRMHLGNLCAALLAWLDVRSAGGRLVLRIEDLDPDRCRPVYAEQLMEDLRWLGLDWDEGPYYQSRRTPFYESKFEALRDHIYPCFCSRADRLAAGAPHPGEERTGAASCPCKRLSKRERESRALTRPPAWKIAVPDETISFTDGLYGPREENLAQQGGDFIVRRADGVFAYQLAVTADDGDMGVDRVVRGRDLLDSTPRQLWLLGQMGYPAPSYLHVPLLTAGDGRRLSKREGDLDVKALRVRYTPAELTGFLAYLTKITPNTERIPAEKLVSLYSAHKLVQNDIVIN